MATSTFDLETSKEYDPFEDDPPFAADFYTAIGRLVVVWGKLERSVDIIAYSARSIESLDPFKDDARTGIKRKLEALRKTFKSHPPVGRSQKWIARLLGDIKSAAKKRNIIIHGLFERFQDDNKKPRITFRSTIFYPTGRKREEMTLTLPQLNALVKKITALDRELVPLVLVTVTAPRVTYKSPE
jgi:hypothetical protein